MPALSATARAAPGVLLCLAVTAAALALTAGERAWTGHAWLEALVMAILVGAALRTCWQPPAAWQPGIQFCAKILLELAVVLLGASLSLQTVVAAGPALLGAIAGVVAVAIAAGYAIGRILGLPHRMAVLVACGNAICGNSAIAAVAPVIGAGAADVAASIGFTAILGVAVVLGLPLLAPILHLGAIRYGALAGLTVYAVPQVLAAAAPMGTLAMQTGTLVKLVRVLMLGPVVFCLSLWAARQTTPPAAARQHPPLHALVPWFIIAFLALAGLRAAGALPEAALAPIAGAANVLTVIAMAALGLGTDLTLMARAGIRVTAAVTLSLLTLAAIAGGTIMVFLPAS